MLRTEGCDTSALCKIVRIHKSAGVCEDPLGWVINVAFAEVDHMVSIGLELLQVYISRWNHLHDVQDGLNTYIGGYAHEFDNKITHQMVPTSDSDVLDPHKGIANPDSFERQVGRDSVTFRGKS